MRFKLLLLCITIFLAPVFVLGQAQVYEVSNGSGCTFIQMHRKS